MKFTKSKHILDFELEVDDRVRLIRSLVLPLVQTDNADKAAGSAKQEDGSQDITTAKDKYQNIAVDLRGNTHCRHALL